MEKMNYRDIENCTDRNIILTHLTNSQLKAVSFIEKEFNNKFQDATIINGIVLFSCRSKISSCLRMYKITVKGKIDVLM